MEKVYVSYEEVHDAVADLSIRIFESFDTDVVISIGEGGMLPTTLLRRELDVPMYAVFCSLGEDESGYKPQITQWLDEMALSAVRGKRILLVNDICDSGATIELCIKEIVRTCVPEKLAVAVLYDKICDKVGVIETNDVRYFVGQYVEDDWIVYPWAAIDGIQDENTDLDSEEDEGEEDVDEEDEEETDDDEPAMLPMSRCVIC